MSLHQLAVLEFDEVVWHPDPAWTGPRERAFLRGPQDHYAELIAYHDGRWSVRYATYYLSAIGGVAESLAAAQRAAFDQWRRSKK